MFHSNGQPVNNPSNVVYGTYNGVRSQAFCSNCNRPWGTCGEQGVYPINRDDQHLVLQGQLPMQGNQFYGMHNGVQTTAFCGNCRKHYGSCHCTGYGAINQYGSPIQLFGEMELMQGLATGNFVEEMDGLALMECGRCYGSCGCGGFGMSYGAYGGGYGYGGNMVETIGIMEGDPGMAAAGAMMAGQGLGGAFVAAAEAEFVDDVVDFIDGDDDNGYSGGW